MKRGPACTICIHPKRSKIDAAKGSAEAVAERFGVKRSTLGRHRLHAASEPQPMALVTTPLSDPPPPGPVNTLQTATDTLAVLRRALAQTTLPDRVPTIANSIAKVTKLIAQLSGELEVSQQQMLRSSHWRRLMGLLDGVLQRHPEAAREWAAKLAEVDG